MDGKLALFRVIATIDVALIAMAGSLGCVSNRVTGDLELASTRLRAIADERIQGFDRDRARPVAAARSFSVLDDESGKGDRRTSQWINGVVTLSDFGDESLNDTRAAVHRTRREPLPGFWETVQRDLRDLPSVFWQDTKDVFTNRTNLLILGTAYGTSLVIQETGPDNPVEDSFRTHRTFKDDFREGFAAIGNPATHFGLAGIWYVIGQQTQDEKT